MTYRIAKTFGQNIKIHELEMVPSLDERHEVCAMNATLNGKPATIAGARHKFAVVRSLDGSESYEWNWETAVRIATEKNGEFKA